MIQFGVESFVLYSAPVDMRKGINTLAQVVVSELGRDPQCGEAFVFIGTRGDLLKILLWQKNGYWLCQHRLERGRFRLPAVRRQDGRACAVSLSTWEWQHLIDGIIVKQVQRLPRFSV
jgi:transposase